MRRITEESAGGVVFFHEDGMVKVILISRENDLVWCLPKGKLENGETKEQAALREVKEETGVIAEIVAPLKAITYSYSNNFLNVEVDKRVDFFLMRFRCGDLCNKDNKVDSVAWFRIEKALEMLTYQGEKDVLNCAVKDIYGI